MVTERIPDALVRDRIRNGRSYTEHFLRENSTPLQSIHDERLDALLSCLSYLESQDVVRARSAPINDLARLHAGLHRRPGQMRTRSSDPKPVAPMVEDAPGCDLKPNPADAATMQELLEKLRALWAWNGRPSTRRIAAGSGNAFSHTTANALLRGTGKVPSLSLDYVRGLVTGLGGSPDEVARWMTAWREIAMAPAARRLKVVNE